MDKKDVVCRIYYSIISNKTKTKDSDEFLKENYFEKGKINCINIF